MWKAALVGSLITLFVVAIALTLGCTTFFGPAACRGTTRSTAITVKTHARQAYYVRNGVPGSYRGRRNPLEKTIGNVIEGARLYDLRCAVCHGTMGIGDGDAGERLTVPPADLSASLAETLYDDDFFLWTISDGGSAFGTDMPPFRNDLSQAQMWKILTFMRAAFAESKANEKPER